MSHDTEEWCKIWRKTDLLFQKWQEFGEFWSEHSKVSKICTLIGPFRAKYITFDQKRTEELSFMTLKSHAKFQEKLTCGLENDMRNLANFHQNSWKCRNWYFYGIILSKVQNARSHVSLIQCNDTMKNDKKSKEKLTCRLKIDIRTNWQILTRVLESLKNIHFNGLLLTKVYNVWSKKLQRHYILWH